VETNTAGTVDQIQVNRGTVEPDTARYMNSGERYSSIGVMEPDTRSMGAVEPDRAKQEQFILIQLNWSSGV
jgi:hypothetical protein